MIVASSPTYTCHARLFTDEGPAVRGTSVTARLRLPFGAEVIRQLSIIGLPPVSQHRDAEAALVLLLSSGFRVCANPDATGNVLKSRVLVRASNAPADAYVEEGSVWADVSVLMKHLQQHDFDRNMVIDVKRRRVACGS